MTDNQGPLKFQLGHPQYIAPAPELPPEPPRRAWRRWLSNPPRMAFLLALVVVIGVVVALVIRSGDDEPMPVKDFDLAAASLSIEPVEAWPVREFNGVALQLPQRFQPLDIDPDVLFDAGAAALGPEWDDVAAGELTFEQFFLDRMGGLPDEVIVYVMTMQFSRRMSPQQIINELDRGGFPRGLRSVDTAVLTLGGVEMARWIIDLDAGVFGMKLRMVQYTIIDNETHTGWLLYCASPQDTFENWLAIFQAAASTFTLVPGA